MPISNPQINAEHAAKASQLIAYLGTVKENLGIGEATVRVVFNETLKINGDVVSELPDYEVVVTLAQIESKFPGTVALLTQIADWLNPLNPDGYKPG